MYNIAKICEDTLNGLFFPGPDNVKIGRDGSVLTIANVRPGNHGQYRCVAISAAGRSFANAVLNVKCKCDPCYKHH